jgi:DNA-binding response OmpR family regulator
MSNILLIEPDRLLAETYAAALKSQGHELAVCATAQSGIFAADEKKPDLVIVELQLVEHSGIEFLYEFRSYSEWQNVPVIVLSVVPKSEFSGSWELLTNQLGISDYLYKPDTPLKKLTAKATGYLTVPA